MYILEIIRIAFASLVANKARALLTMLGIIVGIGAVIAVVALGAGAQQAVDEKIASMIDADLAIYGTRPGYPPTRGRWAFNLDEIRALKDRDDVVKHISFSNAFGGRGEPVKYQNRLAQITVQRTLPDVRHIYRLRLAAGRFYDSSDDLAMRRVAVVGSEAAEKLGGGPEMIGRTIRYKSVDFTVIGVLKPRGSVGWENPDGFIYIPIGIAQHAMGPVMLYGLQVRLVDDSDLEGAATEIERIIRRTRNMQFGEPTAFSVRPPFGDMEKLQQETAATFSSLLLSVATISLIVGGIGVMNIMLVSVTERTSEIGIRKALGARRSNVMLQFVLEAVALCVVGGTLGVAGGVGAVYFFADKFGWITVITPESIILSFGFSIVVGLFFGIYPAWHASRLDPVEALRHE